MKTLITFLGKSFYNKNGEYKELIYDFGGGKIKTKYFGLALAEKLGIEKLVVLGTNGSGWDNLITYHQSDDSDEILELIEKCENKAVTEKDLEYVNNVISNFYSFNEIKLKLIPYCETKEEQYELFKIISEEVTKGDELYIDLTHGFRYMSFFAFTAALYLKDIMKFDLKNVFCGTETGKVIDLTEMLNIIDWVKAFAVYENSGNYGVFASLFDKINLPGKNIENAYYNERTFNTNQAADKLKLAFEQTNKNKDKLFSLFKGKFNDRICWFWEHSRYKQEKSLAKLYLDNGDYLRCATFLLESINTINSNNSSDYKSRKIFFDEYEKRLFNEIRNQLVHGVRVKTEENKNNKTTEDKLKLEAKKYIENEKKLREFLSKFL